MKLWDKEGTEIDKLIEDFTVGNDRQLDLKLALYDVKGSMAHAKMLQSIKILDKRELNSINEVLLDIIKDIESGQFRIEKDFEDVHSKVEHVLTEKLGDTGKKIHTARSRNDQVLVDLCLYYIDEISTIKLMVKELFDVLIDLSEKHKDHLMPGYTHMQIAMPSSFGMWFAAYAETFIDDIHLFNAAEKIANQNPLGSAAGYGSSFPIDRELTTAELGFKELKVNSIASQFARGKMDRSFSFAISSVAASISKLAMDICTYMGQDYGFISFPDRLTTGSSIMPHKKNPDVWELIRAKCNRIQSLPNELTLIQNNLGSGYHRDFQILKESILPKIEELKSCINITSYMLKHIMVSKDLLAAQKYDLLFTVEAVNKLVTDQKMSFREAYQQVGNQVKEGKFNPEKTVQHTHIGSIGNLSNDRIQNKMRSALGESVL